MMRVAVLDDYQSVAKSYADWASLGPQVEVDFFHQHLGGAASVAQVLAPYDVVCLMRERTAMPGAVIAELDNLKLVVTTGMVNASLDVQAARARGITVCGTDAAGPETAEHAFLLIAATLNGMLLDAAGVRRGEWQSQVGRRIRGATLGLLGLGNLGGAVAGYAQAFGMRTVAWSENLTPARASSLGTELAGSMVELFERADVVSIHLKLSDRSRGLVTAEHLAALGSRSYLVNTSRGPIVDEAALIEALRAGTIAGAALDVFDVEPLPAGHPLRSEPRALVTPHTAYVSESTYAVMYLQTLECITTWLAGAPVRRIN